MAARRDSTVLIERESGTGKESIARALRPREFSPPSANTTDANGPVSSWLLMSHVPPGPNSFQSTFCCSKMLNQKKAVKSNLR